MSWLEYEDLNDLDSGEITDNLPTEVLHRWAIRAAESFDSLDILQVGIDAKITELQERKAAIQKQRDNRKAYLLRYVSQLPDKELVVGTDKFKVVETTATKCEIVNLDMVPDGYKKYTFTTDYAGASKVPADITLFGEIKAVADITRIKADSKKGVEISGTEIITAAPSIRKNNKGI